MLLTSDVLVLSLTAFTVLQLSAFPHAPSSVFQECGVSADIWCTVVLYMDCKEIFLFANAKSTQPSRPAGERLHDDPHMGPSPKAGLSPGCR